MEEIKPAAHLTFSIQGADENNDGIIVVKGRGNSFGLRPVIIPEETGGVDDEQYIISTDPGPGIYFRDFPQPCPDYSKVPESVSHQHAGASNRLINPKTQTASPFKFVVCHNGAIRFTVWSHSEVGGVQIVGNGQIAIKVK